MQLTIRSDRSEKFFYNCVKFPAFFGEGTMSGFPNYTALCHWHDDVEFSVVRKGSIDYNINSETVRISEGEGIFINSRQLHYNFSHDRQESEYLCVLLHPVLLCASSYVEETFVTPLLENSGFAYRTLRRDSSWGQRVCEKLLDMWKRQQQHRAQLAIQAGFFEIWDELYRQAPLEPKKDRPGNQHMSALKAMIGYIEKNYQGKVTLSDIAMAGHVSKTSCCKIFQEYVNQSPNAYLIEYRLRNAMELLRTTDMTIAEICFEVGFNGPSYFSESFHKVFGCSPGSFREKHSKIAPSRQLM